MLTIKAAGNVNIYTLAILASFLPAKRLLSAPLGSFLSVTVTHLADAEI